MELDNELVQSHVAQACKRAVKDYQEEWLWNASDLLREKPGVPSLGSPLEAIFAVWFYAVECRRSQYMLLRQYEVEANGSRYRFDFVVAEMPQTLAFLLSDAVPLKVAVELDGHAFHEKTKDQVTYRNKRDRDLQAAGYVVLHFSYDEMTKRPVECVQEVLIQAFRHQLQRNQIARALEASSASV